MPAPATPFAMARRLLVNSVIASPNMNGSITLIMTLTIFKKIAKKTEKR